MTVDSGLTRWARTYGAGLAQSASLGWHGDLDPEVRWVGTPSGARLAFVGGVVLKLHRTSADHALATRFSAVSGEPFRRFFLQPLAPMTRSPDGAAVTAWPLTQVIGAPSSRGPSGSGDSSLLSDEVDTCDVPWAAAGRLLARVHRQRPTEALPVHGGHARLTRAHARVQHLISSPRFDQSHVKGTPHVPDAGTLALLDDLGRALRSQLADVSQRSDVAVAHGDWHIGQLALTPNGMRLLDIDDIGMGDPAWDLGRPAGFWAAGLLDDAPWEAFLGGYRYAGGPGVPAHGDPWPALDLSARSAVFIAAVRALSAQRVHGDDSADALLEACRGM